MQTDQTMPAPIDTQPPRLDTCQKACLPHPRSALRSRDTDPIAQVQDLEPFHLAEIDNTLSKSGNTLQQGQAGTPKPWFVCHHEHFVKETLDAWDEWDEGLHEHIEVASGAYLSLSDLKCCVELQLLRLDQRPRIQFKRWLITCDPNAASIVVEQ